MATRIQSQIKDEAAAKRLIEKGGWRNAVRWKDGYGNYRVIVREGPSKWAQAMRAIEDRWGHEFGAGYRPRLRTVQSDGVLREYVEVIAR